MELKRAKYCIDSNAVQEGFLLIRNLLVGSRKFKRLYIRQPSRIHKRDGKKLHIYYNFGSRDNSLGDRFLSILDHLHSLSCLKKRAHSNALQKFCSLYENIQHRDPSQYSTCNDHVFYLYSKISPEK